MRVRVVDHPKCGLFPGATGTVDLVGQWADLCTDEVLASILRDGGGMCGPYRLHELIPIEEPDEVRIREIPISTEPVEIPQFN